MRLRVASLVALSGFGVACAQAADGSATAVEPAVGTPRPADSLERPQPAASAPAMPGGITLFVADTLADCHGEGPMKCLRIRTAEDQPWSLHYDRIEGFSYEPSFVYELRVERREVPQPSSDAPSFRYRLLQIVSKRKVEPASP